MRLAKVFDDALIIAGYVNGHFFVSLIFSFFLIETFIAGQSFDYPFYLQPVIKVKDFLIISRIYRYLCSLVEN